MATIKYEDKFSVNSINWRVNEHTYADIEIPTMITLNQKQAAALITVYAVSHAMYDDKIGEDDEKWERVMMNAENDLEKIVVHEFYDGEEADEYENASEDDPEGIVGDETMNVHKSIGRLYMEGEAFVLEHDGLRGDGDELGIEDSEELYKACIKMLKGANKVPEAADLIK